MSPSLPSRYRLALMLTAEPELCGRKQPIHDQHIAVRAIVHELGLTVGTDDEERRHLALDNPLREFNIDFAAIIIRGKRPPGWAVPFDRVTKNALGRIGKNRS